MSDRPQLRDPNRREDAANVPPGGSKRVLEMSPARLAAYERVAEAADVYANWHEPRIVPTEKCPNFTAAAKQLRAALSALDTERKD